MPNQIAKPPTKFQEFSLSHQKTRKGNRLLDKLFPERGDLVVAQLSKQVKFWEEHGKVLRKRARAAPPQGESRSNYANRSADESSLTSLSPLLDAATGVQFPKFKATPMPDFKVVSVPTHVPDCTDLILPIPLCRFTRRTARDSADLTKPTVLNPQGYQHLESLIRQGQAP